MADPVPRETVLAVLRSCGVSVSERDFEGRVGTVIERASGSGVPEVHYLTDLVPHRLVMRLAYKFEIEPRFFWHPELIPGGKGFSALPS